MSVVERFHYTMKDRSTCACNIKSQVSYNLSTGVFDSTPGMMQWFTRQFSRSSGSVSSTSSISLEESRRGESVLQRSGSFSCLRCSKFCMNFRSKGSIFWMITSNSTTLSNDFLCGRKELILTHKCFVEC